MKCTFLFPAIRWIAVLCCAFLVPQSIDAGKLISVPSGKITTITQAMSRAGMGDTILVENGVYREHIVVNPGVVLKARSLHKAILNGGQQGTVVTLARKSSLSGFEIRNGTIGVFSKSTGISVQRCKILYNEQTGIMCIRNLARIEDNIIVFNGASGIQLYNVSPGVGGIDHNTIAYNGNNGISVSENSPVLIQNNLIVFNDRYGIALQGRTNDVRILSNDIFSNLPGAPSPPEGNFSFNPAFSSPRVKMDFTANSPTAQEQKGLDNEILGTRFVN